MASGQSNLFQDTAEGLKKNHERSEWAAQAVLGFMNTTGCDASTAIRDLLGSMLHLSDRIGVDFKTELSAGSDFYAQETGDGTCD